MLTVKYFAYGSNIDIGRLRSRVEAFGGERITQGDPYTLRGYVLSFNAGMQFTPFAFANIVPHRAGSVEGILYDLTPAQFKRLDEYEVLYERQYFQIDEDTIACTYVAREDNTSTGDKKPDLNYLNIIIDGCKTAGLKKTYISLVKYKTTNYRLKRGNKHKLN